MRMLTVSRRPRYGCVRACVAVAHTGQRLSGQAQIAFAHILHCSMSWIWLCRLSSNNSVSSLQCMPRDSGRSMVARRLFRLPLISMAQHR